MNRVELQEWLNQFPEDTEIRVLQHKQSPWCDDTIDEVDFQANVYQDYEYVDFSGNRFVKPDESHYGKQILTLGQKDL